MESSVSEYPILISVIVVDVSSFSTFQKFLVFSLILFLILVVIKTGQKILSNNLASDDENTHSMLNIFRKGRDGNIDVVVHVADIFLSVLIACILTAACIYLFAVEFGEGSLYLLFILSVFMGLILFWLFDFVTGILSYVIVRNAKRPAFLMLFFMFIIVLSYPFRKLFERSLRQERIIRRNTLTFSDLSDVIESSEASPEEEQEKELMKGVLNFSDLEVKEIMRSRVDVIAFPAIMKFTDVLKEVVESGYSRFPVYKDNLDNITGILHIKDLLPYLHESEDFYWQKFIRSAMFVPENLKINQLLKQFQSQKNHLAVIVDEYGGTAGIVTLEDIIEEIVGEIDDEFDEATDGIMYEKISEDEFVFDGKTSLNDFCKIIAYPFDKLEDVKGDAETLAGLILSIEGKFPETNSFITFDSIQFQVVAMDNRRIQQVKVKITTDNENKN